MMNSHRFKMFALGVDRRLATGVAERLGIDVAAHELRLFPDGECKIRPLENVRGRDVYVLSSLAATGEDSVNDALCRLLLFIGALRDAAAASVTAVVPYLCYARKDRKTQPRDPLSTRYVAQMFEALGVTRVVTVDVHNPAAYQNAFRVPTENLEAARLFATHLAASVAGESLTVFSPDLGGIHRAGHFQRALAQALHVPVDLGFMEKWRSEGIISGQTVAGQVEGRTVILYDDLISTGSTLERAARACKERGARRVLAAATHGVLTPGAETVLASPALDQVYVTNTVPLPPGRADAFRDKLVVVDAAPLVAHAIESIHSGGSITEINHPIP